MLSPWRINRMLAVCLVALLMLGVGALIAGCGETIDATGVIVKKLDVERKRVGPAPRDISGREFFDDGLQRFKMADVVGDPAEETLVELPSGRGLEVRSGGRVIDKIASDEYLTDFDAIAVDGLSHKQLVLYTYPNSARGGTFRVVTLDGRELTRWDENPPPSRLDVAEWNGDGEIFYIQNDQLVRRSASGMELSRVALPFGDKFQSIHVAGSAGNRLVVLASGDGYTPYHMVSIYDSDGELLFQEIGQEHAFQLEASRTRPDFTVFTRSAEWHFVPRNPH
jgi:hypothetical protein